ncbi:hypothetical protein SDC9_111626 [bioreactor metagenome]|uniref:Uncharacterized protein n=1 Tax=bioreactor metagenome TaxID=1076179 RepID=A0A645BH90_9ZZZZ
MAQLRAVLSGKFQVEDAALGHLSLPALRDRGWRQRAASQRGRGIAHELRGLFVPDGEPSPHHHRLVFLQAGAAALQGPCKAQKLDGGGVVLHRDIGHKGVVFRGLRLAGGHYPGDAHPLSVCKAGGTALL